MCEGGVECTLARVCVLHIETPRLGQQYHDMVSYHYNVTVNRCPVLRLGGRNNKQHQPWVFMYYDVLSACCAAVVVRVGQIPRRIAQDAIISFCMRGRRNAYVEMSCRYLTI